jgi:ATP-dependent Clp protease, protease subunit
MSLVPIVIKKTSDGDRSMDIYSRLLDERIIMLTEEFHDGMAGLIVAQLLFLQSEDSSKDITMYINSPGGSATSMWSIVDTMNLITPDVSTVCIGMAASAASVTLANGAKGKRLALPNSKIMIHQPLGGAQGQATDVEIQVRELIKLKHKMVDFYVDKTGQSSEVIKKDLERDYYMTPEEALKYGIIDKIIGLK